MTESLLSVSIDHGGTYPVSGAVAPLVFNASPGEGQFGLVRYREPAMEPEVVYADQAGNQHGSIATEWAYPDVLHDFAFVTDGAGNETASRLQLAVVRAFLGRLRYSLTVTAAGAPPETWICKPGALKPASERDRNNLGDGNPVWDVIIPAHPIRSL